MSYPPARHVDILAHRYRLEISPSLSDEEMGRCHTSSQLIIIRDDIPPDATKDVILHEIIHAIHYHMELGDGSSEESFTSRTATGLRVVLVQNPILCTWLFSSDTVKKA